MKFKVGDRVKCIGNGVYHRGIKGKTGVVIQYNGYGVYVVEFDVDIKSLGLSGRCENGYAWVCEEDMLEPLSEYANITITRNGNTVTALNTETNEKGIAKCNPSDTFDFYIGSKLALDRLFGKEEKSQVREVKRPAKKGEWVKIVNAIQVPVNDDGTPAYKNGDILHIISDDCWGFAHFRKGADRNGLNYVLAPSEYVVLENYPPTEEVEEPVKETFYNGKVVCVDDSGCRGLYTTGKIYEFVDGQMVCDKGSKFPLVKKHSFEEWSKFSNAIWLEIKE